MPRPPSPAGRPLQRLLSEVKWVMAYIERSILPRLRNTNPSKTFVTAVHPVYLGMHPLPIGVLPPMKQPFPTGGDKVVTVGISGIGTGSAQISAKQTGSKGRRNSNKGTVSGTVRHVNKKGRNNGSKGKKKARGKVPARGKNGKFLKGGK